MGQDKSTHQLEMRKQRGGLRTANTDGGGQKHAQTGDEETEGDLRTANTDGGRVKSTHSLEMRRTRGL